MAIKACFIPDRKDSAQFIIRLLSFYIVLIVMWVTENTLSKF